MSKKMLLLLLCVLLTLPVYSFSINFTPSASDQSVVYLSYIFGVVNGVLNGTGSQILGKMFNVFNLSLLMLGALVAFYTTIMAVLHTGQDGEFMGKKWNSLFVPLRTLFGVMLIVPTSTGYSLIQVAVMWIVLQGVGAANGIWQEVMVYLTGSDGSPAGTLFYGTGASPAPNASVLGGMENLSNTVFCLESLNLALGKLTDSPEYSTYTAGVTLPYQQAPLQTPFGTVVDAVNRSIPVIASGTGVPTVPAVSIPMPAYPTTVGTSSDVNWSFLNGICGTLSFAYPAQTPVKAQVASDGSYSNPIALGLQQALKILDNAIAPIATDVCAVGCDSNENCSNSPTQPYAYQSLLMGSTIETFTCHAPPDFSPYSLTDGHNFPLFWFSTALIPNQSQALLNAGNAYTGLVQSFSTGGSGLNPSSNWMTAGQYFFQLMSYTNGQPTLNGATFAVVQSPSIPFVPPKPSDVNAPLPPIDDTDLTAGTPWQGVLTSPTTYLQACGSTASQGGCLEYPEHTKTNPGVPEDTVDYLEGIMLPLVAKANMAPSAAAPSNLPVSSSAHLPSSYYVVGNFLYHQALPVNSQVTSSAASITNTGGQAVAGFLDVLTGCATLVYDKVQSLANITDTSTNPITTMMDLGSLMINEAFSAWLMMFTLSTVAGVAAGLVPSVSFSVGIQAAGSALLSLVLALVMPLMLAGGMLLYYFPAVPFMIYSFGVIGWVIAVIEGMVAAPIIGIGIMHPEGTDLFGKGDQALMLLLNMFLRPSLMVFGLITSIMMVYVSVWLINSGIGNAVSVMNAHATGFASAMGLIAIPVTYTVIIFNVTEKCFAMIHILPDKVTRWLSGGLQESLGSEMAGLQDKVKGSAQGAMSSYTGAISKGAEGTSMAGAKLGENFGAYAKGETVPSGTVK